MGLFRNTIETAIEERIQNPLMITITLTWITQHYALLLGFIYLDDRFIGTASYVSRSKFLSEYFNRPLTSVFMVDIILPIVLGLFIYILISYARSWTGIFNAHRDLKVRTVRAQLAHLAFVNRHFDDDVCNLVDKIKDMLELHHKHCKYMNTYAQNIKGALVKISDGEIKMGVQTIETFVRQIDESSTSIKNEQMIFRRDHFSVLGKLKHIYQMEFESDIGPEPTNVDQHGNKV